MVWSPVPDCRNKPQSLEVQTNRQHSGIDKKWKEGCFEKESFQAWLLIYLFMINVRKILVSKFIIFLLFKLLCYNNDLNQGNNKSELSDWLFNSFFTRQSEIHKIQTRHWKRNMCSKLRIDSICKRSISVLSLDAILLKINDISSASLFSN